MKLAFFIMAAIFLLPRTAPADETARQLHYVGTTQIGNQTSTMAIDLEVSSLNRNATSHVDIDERVGNHDLGPLQVMLGRSGVIERGYAPQLTFEAETLVDMLSLQFDDLSGIDPGDQWDDNHTHYLVRRSVDGIMDFDVARTMEFSDGTRGAWKGSMRYNATTVVPTAISLAGELVDDSGARRSLRMSARLVGDSFQP
jgi:hypothetical protein